MESIVIKQPPHDDIIVEVLEGYSPVVIRISQESGRDTDDMKTVFDMIDVSDVPKLIEALQKITETK